MKITFISTENMLTTENSALHAADFVVHLTFYSVCDIFLQIIAQSTKTFVNQEATVANSTEVRIVVKIWKNMVFDPITHMPKSGYLKVPNDNFSFCL